MTTVAHVQCSLSFPRACPRFRSRFPRPLGVTDSSPTRSALISILPLIPLSKQELSWLSTSGNREREAFSLTSVKPGAKPRLAAVSRTPGRAAGPHLGAGRHPRAVEHLLADPRGILPGLPRTQMAQAGRKFAGWGRPHLRRGIPGCSGSTRDRAEGARGGSDSPSPAETPSPPPPSPAGSRKGSGGGGGRAEAASLAQRPWGAAVKGGRLGGPRTFRGYILGLALSRVTAPKGWSCPFKRQLAAPTSSPSHPPGQVAMLAEGRWVFPRTPSQSL